MRILGIDPGLTGALALLDGERMDVVDAPRLAVSRGMLDVPEIVRLISEWKPALAVLERQQAMPGQGVSSTFKTGYGYGVYVGVLTALHVPFLLVSPRVWQRELYQGAVGEGKDRSLYVAAQLFPTFPLRRSQHGRADALLIAEYGRRTAGRVIAPRA
jgi:crossover junction endodeoxyribonuclease RuvC